MRQNRILSGFFLVVTLIHPVNILAVSSSNTHSIVQERFNSGGSAIASTTGFTSIHHVGQSVVGRFISTTHKANVGFLHNEVSTFIQMGDINGDGTVDLKDIITGLQVLVGHNPTKITHAGDVNSDNRIGLEEVLHDLEKVSH